LATTDQIIRWAACKWGIDENYMRGQAWEESTWSAYDTGDLRIIEAICSAGNWDGWQPNGYCFQSYGIIQSKAYDFNNWPMSLDSTAFNLDFRGANWRACINGDYSYLIGPAQTPGYPSYPNGTPAQMEMGCLGADLSGSWFDPSAIDYYTTIAAFVAAVPSNQAPWQLTSINKSGVNITAPAQGAIVSGNVNIAITLPNEATDPNDCYACLSIDGVEQSCNGEGGYTWNTLDQAVEAGTPTTGYPALNGPHAIQVDTYSCPAGGDDQGPFYHAAVDVNVNN
jgi:hypothetical protein